MNIICGNCGTRIVATPAAIEESGFIVCPTCGTRNKALFGKRRKAEAAGVGNEPATNLPADEPLIETFPTPELVLVEVPEYYIDFTVDFLESLQRVDLTVAPSLALARVLASSSRQAPQAMLVWMEHEGEGWIKRLVESLRDKLYGVPMYLLTPHPKLPKLCRARGLDVRGAIDPHSDLALHEAFYRELLGLPGE